MRNDLPAVVADGIFANVAKRCILLLPLRLRAEDIRLFPRATFGSETGVSRMRIIPNGCLIVQDLFFDDAPLQRVAEVKGQNRPSPAACFAPPALL